MYKRINLTVLAFVFSLSLIMAGCAGGKAPVSENQAQTGETAQQSQSQGYQDITAETLKQMIDADKNLIIVDVREKDEFAGGHISRARLMPLSEFQSRVNELPKDKKIVLVCLSGSRSSQAALYMSELGYKQVYNLSEGMSAWPYEVSSEQ